MPLIISPNLILTPAPAVVPIAAGTPLILWENKITPANMFSSPAGIAGYPSSNLANPATNLEWRAASIGQVHIGVYSAGAIDGVGIARHNFGTAGIAVEVGYYTGGGSTWHTIAGPQFPATDEPLLFYFSSVNIAELMIRLSPGTAPPRAAVLYAGVMLKMERGVDINPDYAVPRFARHTEFQAGRSDRGDYLGRIVTSQWIDGVEHVYKHLTQEWYREKMDPFVRAAQQDVPFFYAFQPDEWPAEVGYLWLQDDPIAMTSPATRRTNITLRMGGIIE